MISVWSILTGYIFPLLSILLVIPEIVTNESYHITSSSSDSCPEDPCLTLSEFTASVSSYLHTNATLILLPGNHSLNTSLVIANTNNFLFCSQHFSGLLSTMIVCTGSAARFEFISVVHIQIHGLKFLGCRGNRVESVTDFSLEDTYFEGQEDHRGTALELVNSTVEIKRSSFVTNNNKRSYQRQFGTTKSVQTGGAVIVNQSIASFVNCDFEQNSAELGGAIYGDTASKIDIIDSRFNGNHATGCRNRYSLSCSGGAVFSGLSDNKEQWNRGVVSIITSNFTDNEAYYGGGIAMFHTKLFVQKSKFINNKAQISGGAMKISSANISETDFSGNTVTNGNGGAIYVFNSTLEVTGSKLSRSTVNKEKLWSIGMVSIITSNFTNNEACNGGGIAMVHINVSVQRSKFVNNKAEGSGGAMFIKKYSTYIGETDFSGNEVTLSDGCGGAIYVFNSTLEVTSSNLSSNTANKVHGGAICIHEATTSISNCNFSFNEARTFGGAIYTRKSQRLFINGCLFDSNIVISPAGGGRAMRIYREANLKVSNSMFINHEKVTYNNETRTLNHNSNCQESSTNYGVSGVGLHIAFSTIVFHNTVFSGSCESVYAFKCNINFTGNTSFTEIFNKQSKAPTALTTIVCSVFIDGNCTLIHNSAMNGGALYATESRIDVNGELTVANNTAKDSGGGVYLYRSELNCEISSTITFAGNTAARKGGGLYAISSSVKVTYIRDLYTARSTLHFTGNKASNGGGVYLEANAKLYVIKEGTTRGNPKHSSSIFFVDNSADSNGGAVYVADETNTATCDSSLESIHSDVTECFVQVLTLLLTEKVKSSINLIGLEFRNNSAASGAVLFGGLLDRCTLSPFAEVYRYMDYGRTYIGGIMYFMTITNINFTKSNLHMIRSKSVRVCFCEENKRNCNYQPSLIKVTKGKKFRVILVAVDHVNHIVANVAIYSSLKSRKNRLGRGQHIQYTGEGCTELFFSISSPQSFKPCCDKLLISADGPCVSASQSKTAIEVHFQPCHCPVGFERTSNREKCKCKCNSRLENYTTNCHIKNKTLVRESNFWISYVTTNGTFQNCNSTGYLGHLNCPFDYCVPAKSKVEINLSIKDGVDVQCANDHTGILCGQCKRGYSLSIGSSRCIYCPEHWVAQMIGIILAVLITGIVLVILLLVLNLTVATGTINGLIFYANVVSSTSKSIVFASPQLVIAWLNLESGFDGCFISGLDAYWKTWLKFVFPMYVFLLVVIVMVISRLSTKFSRLIGKRNPIATLNTLILLSYTKLLHTVISILSFTILDCPGGSNDSVIVWVVDANIKYLSRKHSVLLVVALLILLAGMLYTILIFSWQWLLYYQDRWVFKWVRNQKLCQFLEPYHAPYTFKHRYWTGLLLFVRIALFVALATNTSQDPYASLVAISVATSSILLMKGTVFKVYKNQLPNILENFCFLNIILICIVNFYTINKGYTEVQVIIAYISGFIITFLILLVVVYHMFTEIIIKLKLWMKLKIAIQHSRAVSNAAICRGTMSLDSSSHTMSVIDAPQLKMKQKRNSENDLREALLESLDSNVL